MELVPAAPTNPPTRARLHIHCPSGHTIALPDLHLDDALRHALSAIAEVHPC